MAIIVYLGLLALHAIMAVNALSIMDFSIIPGLAPLQSIMKTNVTTQVIFQTIFALLFPLIKIPDSIRLEALFYLFLCLSGQYLVAGNQIGRANEISQPPPPPMTLSGQPGELL